MSDTMKSVAIVRMIERPNTKQFIAGIFDDFLEFHGDRLFADDGAIVGGLAALEGIPVTVIGIQKAIHWRRMWPAILGSRIPRDTARRSG